MTISITRDNVADLMKSVRALVKSDVLVGIPDTNAERKPEPGETVVPNNASIGYWMETGLPSQNVPARPFLVPGVKSAEGDIVAQMKKAGEAALSAGSPERAKSAIDNAQNATGLIAQNAVKGKITAGEGFAPLSPRTLEQRQARGRTGTSPLVDTGQLLNSIVYVIRAKGK